MWRNGLLSIAIILLSVILPAQKQGGLPVKAQEVEEARGSRQPYLREMQERSRRGIFPDDELASALAEDAPVALVEVLNISPSVFTDTLSLKVDEVLRGDVPKILPTDDGGGPAKAKKLGMQGWGWMRVQAREHGKYLVAVQAIRPPEKPNVPGEYRTMGVLDLQAEESQWVVPIRKLLELEARSRKEGPRVLVDALGDDSQFIRTRALWKLAKRCKVNDSCWDAAIDAEAELLQRGDAGKREEAINSFETLLLRSAGLKLTFEFGEGKHRMVKEMAELSPPDFSIDKDISALRLSFGNVTLRSKGPQRVYQTRSGERVRSLLETELTDHDLAIGDEAYSLLMVLRTGAPDYKSECLLMVPALRKSFDYSGQFSPTWPLAVQSLTHWSVCIH
jgi:hypothetical protein